VPRVTPALLGALVLSVVPTPAAVASITYQTVPPPPPPGAWGTGYTDGSGVGIGGGSGTSTGGRSTSSGQHGSGVSSGSGGATTCTAHGVTGPITSKVVPDNVIEAWYTSGGHAPPWAHGYDTPGTFYYIYCGGEFLDVEYIPAGTTPPGGGAPAPAIDPRMLAVAARKNIPIGQFTINLSPSPPIDQLVGMPMWMWVTNGALGAASDTVTAGSVTVSARAKATKVIFDMGDGHKATCTDPDATSDPRPKGNTTCAYSYPRSSAPRPDHAGDTYKITATVVWDVSYTVAGAPGGGPLPAITRTASTTVRVAEAQALNAPS
jgi:hypothetical protein